MNQYVTGAMIRQLREKKRLTQGQLAARLNVTDKAVSKWETGKGYPDVTLIEPIAAVLGVSVIELLSGTDVVNENRAFHMGRLKFYVCPVCGNVITAAGSTLVSCCGITLPPQEAEEPDAEHRLIVERVEDEWCVHCAHPMSKTHHLLFFAAVSDAGLQMVKLYPEGEALARFRDDRIQAFYAYCNHHGLVRVPR